MLQAAERAAIAEPYPAFNFERLRKKLEKCIKKLRLGSSKEKPVDVYAIQGSSSG